MEVLSDFKWSDEHGNLFGVYVFARSGQLAGLDLWSIDGNATASSLPNIEHLSLFKEGKSIEPLPKA
jgi:hypothetical protein